MASFSSLPNELLLRICYYVHPNDIISFSGLNRRTHSAATTKLAKHKELHFRWSVMDDHGWPGMFLDYVSFWSNLLRNCLVGSPIVYYMEHLRIGISEPSEDGHLVDQDWNEDTDDMQLIQYQLRADNDLRPTFNPYTAGMSSEEYCKYFGEDLATYLSENWNLYPRHGDYEPTSKDMARVDLIPLLTNLRVLELGWSDSTWHDQLLALVLRVVLGSSEQPECNAFCNLTTVTLEQTEGTIMFSLDKVMVFMALPSIRYMAVSGLTTEDFDYMQVSSLPRSCITHLALIDANIDLRALAELLKDGTPLESFAWNGGFYTVSIESGGLDQILLANAKDTLVHLELVGSNKSGGCVQLQAFTNLQIIIVSDIYLDFPQQPLYALFPATVTTLGINSQLDKQILLLGLHSLLERKQGCVCLPHLTKLRVRTAWDPAEKNALRTASKAVGVRLMALKYSRHDYKALLRT
ncbi:hypothetical protein MMC18_001422 [Xylographa bjoerkii]|nr:hypothetical protein [Xylographa bjoerkii]